MSIDLRKGNVPDSEFDPEQLTKGIEVEKEHTDDETIAKQIAKAHLSEFPNYYVALDKMEKGLKQGDKMEEDEVIPEHFNLQLEEKVVKRGGKWAVVHCHGKDKGKTIASHATKAGAMAQHKAIQANKHKHSLEKQIIFTSAMGQTIFREDDRPPKGWWDDCISGVSKSGGAADPAKVCGNLWYNVKGGKESLEETLQALSEIEELQEDDRFTEGRIYVKNPSQAPKGTAVKRGKHGGYYYDEPVGKQPMKPKGGEKTGNPREPGTGALTAPKPGDHVYGQGPKQPTIKGQGMEMPHFPKGSKVTWQSGAGPQTSDVQDSGIHPQNGKPFVRVHNTDFYPQDVERTGMKLHEEPAQQPVEQKLEEEESKKHGGKAGFSQFPGINGFKFSKVDTYEIGGGGGQNIKWEKDIGSSQVDEISIYYDPDHKDYNVYYTNSNSPNTFPIGSYMSVDKAEDKVKKVMGSISGRTSLASIYKTFWEEPENPERKKKKI